jgi:hypothetical protein
VSTADLDTFFAEAGYTDGFRARCHLDDLPVAFSEGSIQVRTPRCQTDKL